MNMMKKSGAMMFVLAFALLSFSLQAQNRRGISEEQQNERFEKMAANLKMTEEQKTSFKDARQKMRDQMKELRTSSLERDERIARMLELRDEFNEEVKTILTEEQYTQYQELAGDRTRVRRANGNREDGKMKEKKKRKRKGKKVEPVEEEEEEENDNR
jgi:Spy/CpxP family protein refolding chaperone